MQLSDVVKKLFDCTTADPNRGKGSEGLRTTVNVPTPQSEQAEG